MGLACTRRFQPRPTGVARTPQSLQAERNLGLKPVYVKEVKALRQVPVPHDDR